MGKPSSGTPKDKRLKANRPKAKPVGNATHKGTFKLFTKKK